MRALIQRVTSAGLSIEKKVHSSIEKGLVVLLGIEEMDNKDDMDFLIRKITQMRLFDDENGVMNLSVKDLGLDIMLVSQFTLYASTKKGNRPSYIKAAKPIIAIPLYEEFIEELRANFQGVLATGKFGADMQIELINDGPVTIWLDSKQRE